MRVYLLMLLLLGGWRTEAETLATTTPVQRFPAATDKKLGWVPQAAISASASISSSRDVVGQTSGTTETYGGKFGGSWNYNQELSEWRNALNIQELTSKTASLPRFVKSLDDFKFETIYLYFLPNAPTFGPYVRGSLETSLFNGEDVRGSDTVYLIHHRDGSTDTFSGSSLHLTDPWSPLTATESVGAFWKTIDSPRNNLETRLGFGAMEVAAAHQLAVQGTDSQGNINVQELHNFQQLGIEAGLVYKGKLNDQNGVEIGASSLLPLYHTRDPGDNRSDLRLTNYDVDAKLNSKMASWLSFAFEYRVRYQPQLVDQVQEMQLLTLNLDYNLL